MTDTPNRPPLSPAAQAVLDAYASKIADNPLNWLPRHAIAAALRAAVLQAMPRVNTAADRAPFAPILAIAAELKGHRG